MLLVLLAIACLLSVPLRGGRLRRLGDIRLRAEWAALAALLVQVLVLGLFPGGATWWHAVAHVATYGLAAWFVRANRAIPGVIVIAVGGAANLLAIVANGGVMPTSAWAQRAAGLQPTGVFANSAVRDHPHLPWLGDVIPVPLPLGLSNVLSVGDLLIYAGALVLLHRTCATLRVRPRRTRSDRAVPAGSRATREASAPAPR
jgi:Family of unknown function (DUF5317)